MGFSGFEVKSSLYATRRNDLKGLKIHASKGCILCEQWSGKEYTTIPFHKSTAFRYMTAMIIQKYQYFVAFGTLCMNLNVFENTDE